MPDNDERHNAVILFDGYCNLCSNVVQFVLKRDEKGLFKFASLQSPFGQLILEKFTPGSHSLKTFILLQNNKVYTMSTAALLVAKQLGGLYRLLFVFMIVPRFIRDAVYRFIARYRYTWFGKRKSCWVPPYNVKEKFLDAKEATYSLRN